MRAPRAGEAPAAGLAEWGEWAWPRPAPPGPAVLPGLRPRRGWPHLPCDGVSCVHDTEAPSTRGLSHPGPAPVRVVTRQQ